MNWQLALSHVPWLSTVLAVIILLRFVPTLLDQWVSAWFKFRTQQGQHKITSKLVEEIQAASPKKRTALIQQYDRLTESGGREPP